MKLIKFIYTLILALLPCCMHAIEQDPGNAVVLKTKGDACYNAGRYAEALEYYTKALDKAKREDNTKIYYACIGNIGNIYGIMADYKRTLHYCKIGYKASAEANDSSMQWKFITNIVAAYCMMGDVKSAKSFFALQMKTPSNDVTMSKYYFLHNQALIAEKESNLQLAEYYNKQALQYAKERGMPTVYVASQLQNLGSIYLQKGNAEKAIEYYEMSRDSIMKLDQRDQLVGVYRSISEAYTKLGDKQQAEKFKTLYLALSDSIFNRTQFNMANSQLFEYENLENQRQIDTLMSRNYTYMVVIIVFVALSVALTLLYIALRRRNRELLEAQRVVVSKNKELQASDRKSKQLLEQYVSAVNKSEPEQPQKEEEKETEKDERSGIGISEEQKNRLLNKITTVLEDISVISSSDFNLNTLADMVGSNTKYVSWVINDSYGKNFKTLLNEYRIQEACKRLTDTEHYGNMTIQAIYEELGYNSPTSFIQAFRKVNGMTPSVYQKLSRNKS